MSNHVTTDDDKPLAGMTVANLRVKAKKAGLKGYSALRKNELIALLGGKPLPAKRPTLEDLLGPSQTEEKKSSPVRRDLPKEYSEDFLRLRKEGPSKYVQLSQLGKPGKEGTVFLVTDPATLRKYAMKTFRKRKSGNTLEKEAYFQYLAAQEGISPAVIEYNPEEKYIIMELLHRTLLDVLRDQQGKLSENQQRQILSLYRKLDTLGVMINDANPLNLMEKNDRFYTIDYGFAKFVDHKDFKNYDRPNYQLMPLGLLLWMKEKWQTSGWTVLRQSIAPEIQRKLEIDKWA